jgi:hypothetical protein
MPATTPNKRPKDRHARLLSKGFFPPEMPSCFYSERLGAQRDAVLKAFETIPSKKGSLPHFLLFKGERAAFNFPRFGRNERRHSYINPISYFLSFERVGRALRRSAQTQSSLENVDCAHDFRLGRGKGAD